MGLVIGREIWENFCDSFGDRVREERGSILGFLL